ncbi:uncharacterized protein LOC111337486 isoform X2 [Stylophora pistillata]|uniref:uncharacterized protein LOC111337486 isoform X2 n=1 Tax=Stylophora pistillata TaxID=50429 RepID=UPI000C04B354|nr:uncharacterized protein LOC111337486 isoform X2 [Stylophora pistillata]
MKVKTKSRGEMALVIVCLQVLRWISGANWIKQRLLVEKVKETRILNNLVSSTTQNWIPTQEPDQLETRDKYQSSKEAKHD